MKQELMLPEDDRAKEAARRWTELRQERNRFDDDWNDIARLIRPQRGGFGLDTATTRDLIKPLNSDPVIAHGHFAAGIYASITNPATRWGGLATPDEDLNRWPPFAEWLDRQANKIHASFSPSNSSFYSQSYQAYADLAAFGNAAGYDELDRSTRKFRDVTVSLAEVAVDIDADGRVVEVVHRYRLTPRQAVAAFSGKLPQKILDLAEKGDTTRQVYYRHIKPNLNFEKGKLGPRGKRWISLTTTEVEMTVIKVGGYDEMPFYYPRWDVDSGMCYGTGPGFVALSSARKLDLMDQATLRAAQRAADPTKLAPDRDAIPLNGVFRPGSVVYGAVSVHGQRLIQTEDFNGNIGLTIEEKRAAAESVNNAFYYAYSALTGRTGLSNEENRALEEARLRNWAPHADRIMEEYAARKYERRFLHLFRAGQIEPPPEGTPPNMPLLVRYTSAAAMALRATEAQAARQFVGDLTALGQVKPAAMDRLSEDDYAEILHEASPAVPQRLLKSREAAQQDRVARAQAAEAAQQAELAKVGGAGLRDMAQAGAAMGEMMGGEQ